VTQAAQKWKWPQSNLRPFFCPALQQRAVQRFWQGVHAARGKLTTRTPWCLVAALFPVMMHSHVVAHRVMVVVIVRKSRGHGANRHGGKRKREQNLLH
jgi:hypothetical protein